MFGSEDTIARDGIHLIVSTLEGRSYRLGRDLHRLILSNEDETRISTSIEYESEIAGEDRGASPNLPDHLLRSLAERGESAEAFIAGKTYHLWLTKKAAPESRISFTIKPGPFETIYVFEDQKVRGKVSTIHVSFQPAEETIAVATAYGDPKDKATLCVSAYLRQDEFDRLFRHCYLASEKLDLHIDVGLVCYTGAGAILIEEGVTVSVALRSVFSGRTFKSIASKGAELDTSAADVPEARAEDRFEQALVRLEASQHALATSLQRFLVAFFLVIGLLLLTRGHSLW